MKNRFNKSKQKGFTLIELIVVIVILGILAVTAAPKFIDVSSDAKKSQRDGLAAAIRSSLALAHAKAALSTVGSVGDGEITINTTVVNVVKGYPSAVATGTPAGTTGNAYNLAHLIEMDGFPSNTVDKTATANPIVFTIATDCTITVTDSTTAGDPPVIGGTETCA